MTPRLADQDARDRIQGALDETQVVEAAAGTWKRRTSARFTRCVPTCCASGPWKPASIRCSSS
jgi:hypothetical protein